MAKSNIQVIQTRDNTSVEIIVNFKNQYARIKAWSYDTRSSWGHKSEVWFSESGNCEYSFKKIVYYNRTWESFRFESVIDYALREAVFKVTKSLKKTAIISKKIMKKVTSLARKAGL